MRMLMMNSFFFDFVLLESPAVVLAPDAEMFMDNESLLSKKGSKKELTKRPPFLVKSLVCKSSEKTVNGG